MTLKGNCAIWRASNNTFTTFPEPPSVSNSDKIEFDLDALIPDKTAHIGNTKGEFKTGVAENEAPFRSVNELQFTELETVTITVSGHVQNPDASLAEIKLKVWALESQKTSEYPKGRFGARFNDMPVFNVLPTSNGSAHARGYAIESLSFERAELRGRLNFTMVLRLSGDLLNNTGANYDWSVLT